MSDLEMGEEVVSEDEEVVSEGEEVVSEGEEVAYEAARADRAREREQRLLHAIFGEDQRQQAEYRQVMLERTGERAMVLTPAVLGREVTPYLEALADLQGVLDEIRRAEKKPVVIWSIIQGSVEVSVEGLGEAIATLRDDLIPWRRKHAQKKAELAEQGARLRIEREQAEILAARARAAKEREEAKQLQLDYERKRLENERLAIENQKLRDELHQARIELALQIIERMNPNLSEAEKITFVVRLLAPLELLTESDLEITAVS